jgi:hypothetical protein
MSYETNVSIQGAEATLQISRTNDSQVEYTLILRSGTREMEVHGQLSLKSKEVSESVPPALEKKEATVPLPHVEETTFNPIFVSKQIDRCHHANSFQEKKSIFLAIMYYMFDHRNDLSKCRNLLDALIAKCYEMKMLVPNDREVNKACDQVLTYFGKEVDLSTYENAYAEKSREARKKMQEEREKERQQELRQQEEARKKMQEEREKERQQELRQEAIREEARQTMEKRREQIRENVAQRDKEDHLQLLEKVARTYHVNFTEGMYEQYMEWKATYQGNARNRYQRMCDFMEKQ